MTWNSCIRDRRWPYLAAALSLGIASAALHATTFEGRGTAAAEGLRCSSNAVETLVLDVPDADVQSGSRYAWLVAREAHVWRLDVVAADKLTLASRPDAAGVTQIRAQFDRREGRWIGGGMLSLPDVDCRLNDFAAELLPATAQIKYADAEARNAALFALQERMHAVGNTLVAGRLPDVAEINAIAAERSRLLGERHPATLRARWMVGVVLYFHRDLEPALAVVEQTLADQIATLGEQHPDTLRTLSRRGHVHWDRGNPRAARVDLERAYAGQVAQLTERNSDSLLTLNALAQTLRDLGELSEALEAQERFARVVAEVRGRDSRAALLAQHNSGLILRDLGRLDEALARQEAAYADILRTLGPRHVDASRVLDSLATLYSDFGRHEEGLRMMLDALRGWREGGGARGVEVSQTLNNIAGLYLDVGRPNDALPPQQEALDIALEKGGDDSIDTNRFRSNLAYVLADLGRHAEALPLQELAAPRLEASLGPTNQRTLHANLGRATSMIALGDIERGLPLLEENVALTVASVGPAHPISVNAQAELVKAYRLAQRADAERSALAALVDAAEILRAAEGLSAENRQSLFQGYSTYYKRLAVLRARDGEADAALRLAELAKGRTLLEWLAARRAGRVGVLPAEDARRLAELEARVASANDAISAAEPAQRPEFEARKNTLVREASQLRAQLRARHPKYASLSEITLVDRKAAARLLARDQAFVSYVVHEDESIALVITNDGRLRSIALPAVPGLDTTIDAYLQAISAPPGPRIPLWRLAHGGFAAGPIRPDDAIARVDSATPVARYLASVLLDPLGNVLRGKRRWTIAPDGALARLPFETLPWGGQPAVVRHDIAYVQSLSVLSLLANRDRPAKAANQAPLLAMGAPRYEVADSQTNRSPPADPAIAVSPERLAALALRGADIDSSRWFDRQGIRWSELPGAAREVEAVAKRFPGARVFTGSQASEATLQELNRRGELAQYRYLLFATHGFLSLDAPNMSAVVLAQDRPTPAADGYVTAAEWPAYDLRSELAVLSACETGRGKAVQGEGIVGLPFAIAVAGNQATVLTLWQVVDAPSARFVERYFEHLRGGMGKSAALARTKREFLADPRYRAPLYWAGFVFYGE
jgi:CHAT domain-containing protein